MKKEIRKILEELNSNQELINKELDKLNALNNALLKLIIELGQLKRYELLEDIYNLIDLIQERQDIIKDKAEEQERRLIKAENLLQAPQRA